MKNEKEIISFFEKSGALQHGHFILSSGKRSKMYFQCSKLFVNPNDGRTVCEELKIKILEKIDTKIDYIVSPALGGVLVGYQLAQILGCNFIFYERSENVFELRRGFDLKKGSNILFVEDVITTGKSTKECLDKLNLLEVNLKGIASIVDRTTEKVFENFDIISLLNLDIPIFDRENLPEELVNVPAIKPGSRKL